MLKIVCPPSSTLKYVSRQNNGALAKELGENKSMK
jgi:hypothetical protein